MTWTCKYCGHPNLMNYTHCSNCGKPRGYKGHHAVKFRNNIPVIRISKH